MTAAVTVRTRNLVIYYENKERAELQKRCSFIFFLQLRNSFLLRGSNGGI